MPSDTFTYSGTELELFAEAKRWKRYLRGQLAPFLGAEVLEVGAGLGGTTEVLCSARQHRWVCLEPDARLGERLRSRIARGELPARCEARGGRLAELAVDERFDTILYIDVLEHVEHDRAELELAARHLAPGGHLVVVAPAHAWLFSPLDRAVGHYRRYTKRSLLDLRPGGVEVVRARYLDSLGLLASLANVVLLKREVPSPAQLRLWDGVLVTGSRVVDRWLLHAVGKTVVVVWRRG